MESQVGGTTPKSGKPTEGALANDEAAAERAPSSEDTGELAASARGVIMENPLVATLSVFAVGLVTGALLGKLLGRD
jgi:hypothetical protein